MDPGPGSASGVTFFRRGDSFIMRGGRSSLIVEGLLSYVIPANAGIQQNAMDAGPGSTSGVTFFRRGYGFIMRGRRSSLIVKGVLSSVIPANAGIQYSASMKQPCVYILASRKNGTLYTGVTSNLVQRIWQHKNDLAEGFTKKYGVHTLVWFEPHETMESAIGREKAIKEWRRAWKIELVESVNPQWHDLYDSIV